jgi:hypothetical protein
MAKGQAMSPSSLIGVILAVLTLVVAAIPLLNSLGSSPEGVQTSTQEAAAPPATPEGAAVKEFFKYEAGRLGLEGGAKRRR